MTNLVITNATEKKLNHGSRNRYSIISYSMVLNNGTQISYNSNKEPIRSESVAKACETTTSLCGRLSQMNACLFATTLEDSMAQIYIIEGTNNELQIIRKLSEMHELLLRKYNVKLPEVKDELDGIDPHQLGCSVYKLNKLEADRKRVRNVIVQAYNDLILNYTFKTLKEHVEQVVNREKYMLDLLPAEETQNINSFRELKKQLRQSRNHNKTVIYDTDGKIEILRSNVEDGGLTAEMQSRYIDNWQLARTEQNIFQCSDLEEKYTTVVEYYKHRSDYEQRVHSEVEILCNVIITETLEKIEEWMNKYDKDMEQLDLKIQIKRTNYQNTVDKREALEKTLAKHDMAIKDWIHFKEEREKARLYREKMTKSAIIVQAWWRGLLVRRQLGPYKVKKDKKKKKK